MSYYPPQRNKHFVLYSHNCNTTVAIWTPPSVRHIQAEFGVSMHCSLNYQIYPELVMNGDEMIGAPQVYFTTKFYGRERKLQIHPELAETVASFTPVHTGRGRARGRRAGSLRQIIGAAPARAQTSPLALGRPRRVRPGPRPFRSHRTAVQGGPASDLRESSPGLLQQQSALCCGSDHSMASPGLHLCRAVSLRASRCLAPSARPTRPPLLQLLLLLPLRI